MLRSEIDRDKNRETEKQKDRETERDKSDTIEVKSIW